VDVVVARIKVGLAGLVGSGVGGTGVGGISVGTAVAGGSVGAGVAAGAQALSNNITTISKLNNKDKQNLILFS